MTTSQSSARTLQETTTALPGDEVLARAKAFFASRPSLYATFIDMEAPSFVSFRGQGGEEIVIAVAAGEGGTRVTGSSYLFDMQVSRFFTTLTPGTV
jgi:hypothetical protein